MSALASSLDAHASAASRATKRGSSSARDFIAVSEFPRHFAESE
jgi:hypothetical protein